MMMQLNHRNKVHSYSIRTTAVLLIIIAAGLTGLSGCGISDIPIYESPYIASIAPGVISITHNTSNNIQSFIGYKVYYKLYKPNDIDTITEDRDYITDTTRTPYPSTITTRKFRELVPVSFDGSNFQLLNIDPLIKPSNKAAGTTYYLDFSAGAEIYPGSTFEQPDFIVGTDNRAAYQMVLIESSNMTILHRNVNNSEHKPFFNNKGGTVAFLANDSDVKSMMGNDFTNDETFDIVFAVIPYGIDFSNLQKTYGTIVMSGEDTLDSAITPQ